MRGPPVLASCIEVYYFLFFFFNSRLHLYGFCLFHIPTPIFPIPLFFPFPLSFTVFPPEPPPPSPLENVTAVIHSYAVLHLHESTGKLRKTCTDSVSYFTASVPSLQSLKKWPFAQCFDMQVAGGGHPSKYWPSAKLLNLCDCLIPDNYHKSNVVGHLFSIFLLFSRDFISQRSFPTIPHRGTSQTPTQPKSQTMVSEHPDILLSPPLPWVVLCNQHLASPVNVAFLSLNHREQSEKCDFYKK